MNVTRRIKFDNGMVGYHKPFSGLKGWLSLAFGHDNPGQQPIHEFAAWKLASGLGEPYSTMVPPVVIREVDGQLGSVIVERPGLTGSDFHKAPLDEAKAAAFFDALIGQQDRHGGNYLMAGDRITLIDHGFSFAKPGDRMNQSRLVSWRADSHPRLEEAEIACLAKVVASGDLFGLRATLEPDRVDALQARARLMLLTGRILPPGQY